METYNWIKAYYTIHDGDDEREIFVRQEVENSETFVDDKGKRYHISELDLTHGGGEFIPVDKSEGLKWLLESMDANSIADHKAKIDEREYWRKLRGEIFKMVFDATPDDRGTMEGVLEYTKKYFDAIYNQDQEFIKDK